MKRVWVKAMRQCLLFLKAGTRVKIIFLVAIPNPELLVQWTEMIDEKYSIPYIVMNNAECRNEG
jgi:hypothetical protein